MATAVQAAPTFELIAIAQLAESPLNTRKHFDQVKLAELRASIEQIGIRTPLLVRPKGANRYEIAGGHRRFRAAQLAGLEEVPCLIEELDDATFLEILSIDNLQREDVHPLEEAQGYKNLLTLDGYDIAKIATRVGKSESYVYDRMKLLQLNPKAQKLFLSGAFTAGHAILLARLSKKDQERCLSIDNENGYQNAMAGGMWQHEGPAHDPVGITEQLGISDEDEWGEGQRLKPVSVRELQAWIDKYVRMDEAQVDRQLFPETAAAIGEALVEKKAKIIHITRDHLVHPDAKDPTGKRTYGNKAWKRADGQDDVDQFGEKEPSKTCDHSVLGLVVTGLGRGESFHVCIDKKRCTTHWKAEIQERNRREREKEEAASKPAGKASSNKPGESSWERDERIRKEKRARAEQRWEKGGPAVLQAIGAALKKSSADSTGAVGKFVFETTQEGLYGLTDLSKQAAKFGCPRGNSAVDFMRNVAMATLIDLGEPDGYGEPRNEAQLQEALDGLKIKVNVKQLLDAANPEPKAEKAPAAKKVAKKKAGKKKP